jgi:hypothetical protein
MTTIRAYRIWDLIVITIPTHVVWDLVMITIWMYVVALVLPCILISSPLMISPTMSIGWCSTASMAFAFGLAVCRRKPKELHQ